MLTALGPPSILWAIELVLAAGAGSAWAGADEGSLAGVDGAFFPEGSSSGSDGGLFMPAMPPTGREHMESGRLTQATSLQGPISLRLPSVGFGARGWYGPLRGPNGGRTEGGTQGHVLPSKARPDPWPLPNGNPNLGSGKRDFSVFHQEGLALCPERFWGFLKPGGGARGWGGLSSSSHKSWEKERPPLRPLPISVGQLAP